MALTTLDPASALIVVDLQRGITSRPIKGVREVVENSAKLAEAFRRHGLPVVLVNVTGLAPGRTEQPRPALPFDADFADSIPRSALKTAI